MVLTWKHLTRSQRRLPFSDSSEKHYFSSEKMDTVFLCTTEGLILATLSFLYSWMLSEMLITFLGIKAPRSGTLSSWKGSGQRLKNCGKKWNIFQKFGTDLQNSTETNKFLASVCSILCTDHDPASSSFKTDLVWIQSSQKRLHMVNTTWGNLGWNWTDKGVKKLFDFCRGNVCQILVIRVISKEKGGSNQLKK